MTWTTKKPLARQDGLIIQELPDEMLVYDSTNDKAHCLNQSAALVWQYCDGKKTPIEITRLLSQKLKTPIAEEFVWLALEQLEKENLFEKRNIFGKANVSRRDVLKRIGLATAIALPIVTSLINPMSTHAVVCNTPCPANPNNCALTPGCIAGCTSTGICRDDPNT